MGFITDVQIWGNVEIALQGGGAIPPGANITFGPSSLKTIVRKCDVSFNTQLVASESVLTNYWEIKQQEKCMNWEDETLDIPVWYNEATGADAVAGESIDSHATYLDIKAERVRKAIKLGVGIEAAGCTAGAVATNTTKSERVQFFSLKDILIEDDNFIPAFCMDQASIQLQISHDGLFVPIDMEAAPYADIGTAFIKLTNCEVHYYYYSVTQDMVRAIRQSAELLEADGTSAYGISFKTKRVGCVPWALNSSNYSYDHSVPGTITKKIYLTMVDRRTNIPVQAADGVNGILAAAIKPQFAPGSASGVAN